MPDEVSRMILLKRAFLGLLGKWSKWEGILE